jgi:hypothetical protein
VGLDRVQLVRRSLVIVWSSRWNENCHWKRRYSYVEKTLPNDTLSTANPTKYDLGSNLGFHCWKPATNRLSCGTVLRRPYCAAVPRSQLSGCSRLTQLRPDVDDVRVPKYIPSKLRKTIYSLSSSSFMTYKISSR